MINEFVEKIIVHAPEKIDGDRVQEVEIHLRFIGQFELPAPEPVSYTHLDVYKRQGHICLDNLAVRSILP